MLTPFKGKLYPSGDLTLYTPHKVCTVKKDTTPSPLDGIDSYVDSDGKTQVFYDAIDNSPMGLSVATNSHRISESRTRQGLKGIGRSAKIMLRSGTALLGRSIPRRLMTFLTVTTPAITEAENAIVNAEWSEMVRQLEQQIKRELVRAGIKPEITYCVEVQEQRYTETGIVALHLHLVFQGKLSDRSPWAITPARIDKLWRSQLERVLDRPVDVSAANKLETPKKPLEKEIGKYISKGGSLIAKIIADGKEHLIPRSWWGMTTALKQRVKAAIVNLDSDIATWLSENSHDLPIKLFDIRLGETYKNKLVARIGWIEGKSFQEEIIQLCS
jgi:hypothetical protein